MNRQGEEPKTMARVQGAIEERWPKRSYTVWISRERGEVRRHVAVRFGRVAHEGIGATWLEAMDQVDRLRPAKASGAKVGNAP